MRSAFSRRLRWIGIPASDDSILRPAKRRYLRPQFLAGTATIAIGSFDFNAAPTIRQAIADHAPSEALLQKPRECKPRSWENRLHPRMESASTIGTATSVDFSVASEEDFEELMRLYWPRVFRFVLASLRDREAAENVAQDCFFRAYKGRANFRGECSLNTWLMQIAVNLVRDHARNRKLQFWRRAEALRATEWMANGEISPEAGASLKQQVEAVWSASRELSERQRTVFLLRFVEEMDILEIAAATGMKEGTVKTHLFRALQAVRERVGKTK